MRDREIYIERINYQTFSRDLNFGRKSLYAIHFVFFGGNNQSILLQFDSKFRCQEFAIPFICLWMFLFKEVAMGFI